MILKIFTQQNCPICPPAKKLANDLRLTNSDLRIEEFDVATADGLAEAAFYQVMATPSLILVDQKGKEIWDWRGRIPSVKEILEKLKQR